jgi:hypothetical protein
MSAAKRAATFRLDDEYLDALQKVKERHGIPITEQVKRGLGMWFETMGVSVRRTAKGSKNMSSSVTKELRERLRGAGRILDEHQKVLGACKYNLAVWQEIHEARTFTGTSRVEGLSEVVGEISADAVAAKHLAENLTLELQDGRQFPFFFADSSGTIAARGPIAAR